MATTALRSGQRIRGGEVVARMLAAEGVRRVFGIIDGTYFGLYSTLERHGIELVSPRHEATAAHMAGAHARLTGGLGVCIASNGPGVANVLGGVAVEHAEGNRVLLVTSCRRDPICYPDRGGTFQCFPQVAVTAPMTKWACAVPSITRLAEILRKALRLSFTGRPGVVHVDVPENILNGTFEARADWFREPGHYRPLAPPAAPEDQLDEAARLLAAAERPLLHAGSGVLWSNACPELAELAARLDAPVTTSWAARSVADERSERVLPLWCLPVVDRARVEADVVLALGSRIGETDWWGKPPHWGAAGRQTWIQVDVDTEQLAVTRAVELPVLADARTFLCGLLARLEPATRRRWTAGLGDARRAWRKKLDKHLGNRSAPMGSAHVPAICRRVTSDDAVLVIDGGNAAIWAHFFHQVRTPRTVLATFKMGMLGAGTGQALGAKATWPERQVVCITGDGAFGMHQQEIETAVRHELPVVFVVLCDRQWGMVKMNQQFALKPLKTLVKKALGPGETINADFAEVEFDRLAAAMGAHGERVSSPDELAPALKRALAAGRCAVVHVDVDPTAHMWAPSLRTFKKMHEEPAG